MKETILAALNAAGIAVAGLSDPQLLAAYNSLQAKPAQDALTAANAKLAQIEANAQAAEAAELDALAASMAVNSVLTAIDLKALGLTRLREIQANAKGAAPVLTGNGTQTKPGEFDGYTLNAHIEGAK